MEYLPVKKKVIAKIIFYVGPVPSWEDAHCHGSKQINPMWILTSLNIITIEVSSTNFKARRTGGSMRYSITQV